MKTDVAMTEVARSTGMKERRRYRRIPFSKKIEFGVDRPSYGGYLIDISMAGTRIASNIPLPPGTDVKVAITNGAGSGDIRFNGKVVWMLPPDPDDPKQELNHMGIRLTWHDEHFLKYLATLIERRRMDNALQAEQREHVRFAEQVQVIFDDPKEILRQLTENISKGGLFITTDQPKAKGETVQLRMVIPQIMEDIHVEGKVAFSIDMAAAERLMRPPGMGVKFVKFAKGDREKFTSFIEKLALASKRAGLKLDS